MVLGIDLTFVSLKGVMMNTKISFEDFLDLSLDVIDQVSRADMLKSYPIICRILTIYLDCDYSEVWLKDTVKPYLIPTQIYYAKDTLSESFAKAEKNDAYSLGKGFPGLAWKHKKPLWFTDITHNLEFSRASFAKKAKLNTCLAVPFFVEDYVDGVILFFNHDHLDENLELMRLMHILSGRIGLHLLKKQLDLLNNPSFCTEDQSVVIISKIFNARDQYTSIHENYVKCFSLKLADLMNFSDKEKHDLTIAASLHDIGKIGIPMEILSKPSNLSKEEFNLIKNHVLIGYELIRDLSYNDEVKRMVLEHHERNDGSGYPYGLDKDHIYIGSQLLAVADVVSAMLENRPYRVAHDKQTVIDELEMNKGIKYNTEITDYAIGLIKKQMEDCIKEKKAES